MSNIDRFFPELNKTRYRNKYLKTRETERKAYFQAFPLMGHTLNLWEPDPPSKTWSHLGRREEKGELAARVARITGTDKKPETAPAPVRAPAPATVRAPATVPTLASTFKNCKSEEDNGMNRAVFGEPEKVIAEQSPKLPVLSGWSALFKDKKAAQPRGR